jgi:hypothetical protein
LFVRFSVYGGQDASVAARLLNRRGKELGALQAAPIGEGVYQITLPLSASLRDDYVISIEVARGAESTTTLLPFRVR